jgi:hypothetical protein
VRPHLEFAIAVWNPVRQKMLVKKLEDVQRRATKIVKGISKHNEEERRMIMKLPSLIDRRRRGDLIQQFKIVNGLDRVEW